MRALPCHGWVSPVLQCTMFEACPTAVFTPLLTAGFSCLTCEWVVNPLDNKCKHIFLLNLFPFTCHKFWLVEYMKSNCIVDCGSTSSFFSVIFNFPVSEQLSDAGIAFSCSYHLSDLRAEDGLISKPKHSGFCPATFEVNGNPPHVLLGVRSDD